MLAIHRYTSDVLNRLRQSGWNKWLLSGLIFTLLLVQQAGLHIHNHEILDEDAFTVHVLGGQQHTAPHDQSGEIDLSFNGLILKALTLPDLYVAGILLLLLLPLFSFRLRSRFEPALKSRLLAFRLRPPSRASPL